jgi:hypothetical protein
MMIRLQKWNSKDTEIVFVPVYTPPHGYPWWNCNTYSELPCN